MFAEVRMELTPSGDGGPTDVLQLLTGALRECSIEGAAEFGRSTAAEEGAVESCFFGSLAR
jgi:hypothetical protein